MKTWQLNRRVNSISQDLTDPVKTETRMDFSCLTEPERELFGKVREVMDKYAPGSPPQDVIAKNADLWNKGLEIFGRRAMELFVEVMPASLCCDELEEWCFKLYFYNFWVDWMESIQKVREMPKEQREALLCERREIGMLEWCFGFQEANLKQLRNRKQRGAMNDEAFSVNQED